MLKRKANSVKSIVAPLLVAASLFCVLAGQGIHLHDVAVHFGDHFDVHAHVHAHESHDEPLQDDHNEDNDHRHEVSTASDIIGTLTSPYQVKPDIQSYVIHGLDTEYNSINPRREQSLVFFGLPPPRPVSNQYHLSSSRRGPPVA